MAGKDYPVFDHDQHGHPNENIVPGSLFFDEAGAQRVLCSEHGDSAATDGSLVRGATEAQVIGANEKGHAVYGDAKPVGKARLYRCTVCGQGTWSHLS